MKVLVTGRFGSAGTDRHDPGLTAISRGAAPYSRHGDQVLALAAAMRRPEYGLLVRFAVSGLRAGEIGALRVGRLDLLRSRVDVAETVAEVTGHGLVYGPPKT